MPHHRPEPFHSHHPQTGGTRHPETRSCPRPYGGVCWVRARRRRRLRRRTAQAVWHAQRARQRRGTRSTRSESPRQALSSRGSMRLSTRRNPCRGRSPPQNRHPAVRYASHPSREWDGREMNSTRRHQYGARQRQLDQCLHHAAPQRRAREPLAVRAPSDGPLLLASAAQRVWPLTAVPRR